MKKKVCVAGGGPAGLALAVELSSMGHEAIVFEKKSREGAVAHYSWPDSVDLRALVRIGLPEPKAEGDLFVGEGVKETVPSRGLYLPQVPDPRMSAALGAGSVPVIADRGEQERLQIELAEKAGVEMHFGAEVTDLCGRLSGDIEKIEVTGLTVREKGEKITYSADLVADATGYVSALRQKIALPDIAAPFKDEENFQTYRVVVPYDGDLMQLSEKLTRPEEGKGYLWTTPLGDNYYDIGCCYYHDDSENKAKEYVEGVLRDIEGDKLGERAYSGYGYIPVSGSPKLLVLNGFAVVGDSACMANKRTGCGAAPALWNAVELAQVIDRAESCTIGELWSYAAKWFKSTEDEAFRFYPEKWDAEEYKAWRDGLK